METAFRVIEALAAQFVARERVLLLDEAIMAALHSFHQTLMSTLSLVQVAKGVLR